MSIEAYRSSGAHSSLSTVRNDTANPYLKLTIEDLNPYMDCP